MEAQIIDTQVRSILTEVGSLADLNAVGSEESLLERGVLDSAAMIDLIEKLEDSYGVSIEEDELVPENFDSIRAIASFVAEKRAAR